MKVDYGLRALGHLAQNHGRGACLTADIAADQAIPLPFLKQLLTSLRKAGIVQSRRGRQGGHMLAMPPTRIPLYDVMVALESSPILLDCLSDPKDCFLAPSCPQRLLWQKVSNSMDETLKATTLGDLAEEQQRLSEQGIYSI